MYATQALLIDRFGERMLVDLSDRGNPPAGAIDAAVVARALADTDAIIDGYLAGRYALPLSEVPPQLTDLALSIAIYKLHRYAPDAKIKDDHDQALRTLVQISNGTVRLPAAGVEPAGATSSGVETIDRARDLTPEGLRGFI